mmetsp:Transcript_28781/g.72888  ORF Transcript_28781/g.72888 Transcript_28781/m.72888 type:complete len:367 (+) Transcript_28781:101-1201(+)
MASLSYYCGGEWMTFPYGSEPRRPKIEVHLATPELCKFTLTDTDVSVANSLRRVILAEVPSMAIDIVNVEENETVIFDEFIAHRMGLLPLSAHAVGDIPPDVTADYGYTEFKDCSCFDGCPYCSVEFKLDVHNPEDRVMSVTHFEVEKTSKYQRDNWPEEKDVNCLPKIDPALARETDEEKLKEMTTLEHRENGVLIAKLKKDQHLKMICMARKGIPKYHAKYMPVATSKYQFQPVINLDREMADSLTLDEKIDLVQSCPRKVFELDVEDKVQVERLMDCIFCDECVAKAQVLGKRSMVTVKMDANTFHFTVEAVTKDGPRTPADVVRAGLRILEYKMSRFLQDAYKDDITEWLPLEPQPDGLADI